MKYKLKDNYPFRRAAPLFTVRVHPQYPLVAFAGKQSLLLALIANDEFELIQLHEDEHSEESFLCCEWLFDPLLSRYMIAVSGNSGIVKVIDPDTRKLHYSFSGHGAPVNQIRRHPCKASIFFTASADNTSRMWSVSSPNCLAIFGGDSGHKDQVLSVDIHHDGGKIATSSIDGTIKIWDLSNEKLSDYLKTEKCTSSKPVLIHTPCFSSGAVLNSYIDDLKWYGDLVFCKSTTNRIVLFKPEYVERTSEIHQDMPAFFITEFVTEKSNVWFIRFALSESKKVLAVGNQIGHIYLWEIENLEFFDQEADETNRVKICRPAVPPVKLINPKTKSIVREINFSNEDRTLMAVHDDGTFALWTLAPK